MSQKKTIAIFGAGTGLGASLATLFGREGYRVALVARRAAALEERVAELAKSGIEAAAFPADLNDLDGIPTLVRTIKERFGTIDVAVYAPVSPNPDLALASSLNAARLQSVAGLFLYSPVELSHALLPDLLERGDGAIVLVGGLSAVIPMPGLSPIGQVMAATRNYALTLNAEVLPKGVYVGSVSIGALIDRSAGKSALEANGVKLDIPTIDPDDIAQEVWGLVTKRDRPEALLPPLPHA
ncbi:TPA: SDR family NAD(P)-dependent oxidoreductase [Klebsiella variicola subsp. variicola]|nr:SDR family NAD(P)-dependent oxidoreductase [Klebsiella variicola subsp. variicola]